jgi:hypothetical protein
MAEVVNNITINNDNSSCGCSEPSESSCELNWFEEIVNVATLGGYAAVVCGSDDKDDDCGCHSGKNKH